MRVSRHLSVIAGIFALILLAMAIALSSALNRIEQLEGALPSPTDVDRDRQQLREEIESLRRQLETERTKNVALQAALELARARQHRPSSPGSSHEPTPPPSNPTEEKTR